MKAISILMGGLGLLLTCSPLFGKVHTVKMYNNYYEPDTIRIEPGDKIIWVNKTRNLHTATSGTNCTKDGKWNSGYLRNGDTYSMIFDSAGLVPYFCIPHCLDGMDGLIIIGREGELQLEKMSGEKR